MRYLTAGESHGPALTVIIEGVPAQLALTSEQLREDLARRQGGHGRGRRMQIETDSAVITAGMPHALTLRSPICLTIENKDYRHWHAIMDAAPLPQGADPNSVKRRITRPRPGHADLAGGIKYNHRDLRNVLERSSARETAARVAAGAVAKRILREVGVEVVGHVIEIGGESAAPASYEGRSAAELRASSSADACYCCDSSASARMVAKIDEAKAAGDSIGGIVAVSAFGMPPGVGSYVHYDRKLDGRLALAMMSINAFKGVEIGLGFEAARQPGSRVHDEIIRDAGGYRRATNRLGGLEGGMTTGMPVVVKGAMKPIPTLYKPLGSVDIESKEPFAASIERSDSCAVPAASVVAEAVIAWELAAALLEQFPSDHMPALQDGVQCYRDAARNF